MKRQLKTAVTALGVLALLAGAAQAQQRPYSPKLTCGAAKNLVQSRGAVVIGTAPDQYDRYVSTGGGQCGTFEDAIASFVPTSDNPQCFIGYRCQTHISSFD